MTRHLFIKIENVTLSTHIREEWHVFQREWQTMSQLRMLATLTVKDDMPYETSLNEDSPSSYLLSRWLVVSVFVYVHVYFLLFYFYYFLLTSFNFY